MTTTSPFELGEPGKRDLYTPTRLNREARLLLERGLPALWLTGEISNLSRPSSGHWYFSLKDTGAQLRSAMFRQRNTLTRFTPRDGMHVLARGRVSLYEPRGDYQFIVEHLEEAGEGALRRQFELLKTKLAAAGLFALERKRPLPPLPKRVGVITSPTGAAIRDVLHVLKRRFPLLPVRIYPVAVQGAQAASQIAAAIALASSRRDCDVLILARGGGSLEDLWSFNEELVARAIYECSVPVVTGIGHEVDFTIADFVADARAPTPSAAAAMVAPDINDWLRQLQLSEKRIVACLQRALERYSERFARSQRRLTQLHPGVLVRHQAQRVDELDQRLRRVLLQHLATLRAQLAERTSQLQRHSPALRLADIRGRLGTARAQLLGGMQQRVQQTQGRLALVVRTLHAVSPLATLQRGYAIVTDSQGRVVTDSTNVAIGNVVEARLANGRLSARVEWLRENEP
ncbi:MAG: exodeoxyribonuclease VII large subunit [Candidatus Obscuribacterales bacterium]|nr:exodeoxyribonuclease VII large subunit [Steroidobacteraceae bacterium]